jgi:C-terminal binding protein
MAEKGITVCNVPGSSCSIAFKPSNILEDYGTEEIADHAIALMLALRRGLTAYHDLMRDPDPIKWNYVELPIVHRLRGATFGIVVRFLLQYASIA